VTSFDWSWTDPNQIATSSIDTTCTVWDLTTRKVKTQLIAHDKEVFDIAWSLNKEIFATAGADGSLRLFDLRSLEHSTIMYETANSGAGTSTPLLRIAWNRLDNFYIAAVSSDSTRTVIIDVRMPSQPYTELVGQVSSATSASSGHMASISAVAWAPHSACHIVTGADDAQALIWDLSTLPEPVDDPILAYTADSEINSLCWSPSAPDWVSISFGSKVQILKV
jgi:WD repeat-containing protein 68